MATILDTGALGAGDQREVLPDKGGETTIPAGRSCSRIEASRREGILPLPDGWRG